MTLPTQTSLDITTPCEQDGYYYDEQLRRYITQFMAVFSEMHVKVGASQTLPPRLIRVPVIYGSRDRVVAWIKSSQTQNKPLRLPAMSVFLRGVVMAPELRKGVAQVRRNVVARNNGQPFPENIETVRQLMPVPYRLSFELSVFSSNDNQHFQIMEQIMLLFDPQLQIQTGDDPLDWTQITTVTLDGLQWEENFPAGADRRITQSVLAFNVVCYLSGPAQFKKDYINSIKIRLAVVPNTVDLSQNFDVLNAIDAEGIQYVEVFNGANIDIEKP